jgi:hypothetical protein
MMVELLFSGRLDALLMAGNVLVQAQRAHCAKGNGRKVLVYEVSRVEDSGHSIDSGCGPVGRLCTADCWQYQAGVYDA